MSNSDGRVLKFFVSGALLAGASACTKETEAGHPGAPGASEAAHVVEQEPSATAPKVPVAETLSGDAGVPREKPEIGPPKRVNTNYQQEQRPPSAVAPEPRRVNPSFQDEPPPPPAPPPTPKRVNTNYQQEIPARPRAPAKLQEESTNTGPEKNKEKASHKKES